MVMICAGLSLTRCWLLYRAVAAEYRYYKAVQTLLPEVWASLGEPKGVRVPWVFVLPKTTRLLSAIKDEVVLELAQRHHRTGRQFLLFVITTLVLAILVLKSGLM